MRRPSTPPPRIAAFVSPHGFGHAARASAVMAAMLRRVPVSFEIFSTVPEWFFRESLLTGFTLHRVACDVGFRQHSALHIDAEATLAALRELVPFSDEQVDSLADDVRDAGCRAVLCDISPLGIAVAERAGVPSVLVESFDWPYLYEPLHEQLPELAKLGAHLTYWTERATRHVQAEPACVRDAALESVPPISREATRDRAETRAKLGLPADGIVVVLTMGGYGEALPFLDQLKGIDGVSFLVTGLPQTGRDGNLHIFDNNTPLFMPNVLRSANAVVAKLGYGTLSEAWREGLPFAYVTRPHFREMEALEAFAGSEVSGFAIRPDDFVSGAWIERLDELIGTPRRPHERGGADRAAEVVLEVANLLP